MASTMKITLPKGLAVHPHLSAPDYKYDTNGVYQSRLRVPVEAAKPVMDKIASYFESYAGKKLTPKDNTVFELEEDDTGERTGNVLFKVKAANKVNRNGELWDRKPRLVDASGQPTKANIGAGSTIRIGCEIYAWTNSSGKKGVSLQPQIVQVIDLVEPSSSVSLEEFGIEAEDGYSASNDSLDDAFMDTPDIMEADDHDDF